MTHNARLIEGDDWVRLAELRARLDNSGAGATIVDTITLSNAAATNAGNVVFVRAFFARSVDSIQCKSARPAHKRVGECASARGEMAMLYYYSQELYFASGDIRTLASNDQAVVSNTAHLIAEAGSVFRLLGGNRISIAGELFAGVSAIVGSSTSNNNNIRILASGSVFSANGYAISLEGTNSSVVNAGTIDGLQGVRLIGENSQLTNDGDIFAVTEAVLLGQSNNVGASYFANTGTIVSATSSNAISLRGGGSFNVVNSGTIVAQRGNAFDLTSQTGALTLTNTGLIQAARYAIYTDGGDDSVTNSGTIVGVIRLVSGDDLYAGAGGQTVGVVEGGFGNDILQGGSARDVFNGEADDDELDGAGGNDLLDGGTGNDIIDGGDGNDVLIGESGFDTLDGGAGRDIASYRTSGTGVLVDLADVTLNTGDAAGDTYVNIEVYQGGAAGDQLLGGALADIFRGGLGGDTLNGRDGNDTLYGEGGDDVLIGGLGNDRLFGGDGSDTASYATATGLVRVNLSLFGAQNTTSGGRDTLDGIENLLGSAFNDVLTGDLDANAIDGSDGADQIDGGDGNDLLTGGAGDDRITGGLGTDTASYAAAAASVTLNLAVLIAQATGGAGSDTILGIEDAIGSAFDDVLTGSTLNNVLTGGIGNDQLSGGDGDDRLIGGLGNDTLTGGGGRDTADYSAAEAGVRIKLTTTVAQNTLSAGNDTLTGIEALIGSAFADNFTGDGAANTFEGGAGDDSLNGGGGLDTASYRNATSAITVDLAIATAQDTGGAGMDELTSIESLIGSVYDDALSGSGTANRIEGLSGFDILTGLAGNDTLLGGVGNDQLFGGADNDTLYGGEGDNVLNGGDAFDTVSYADSVFAVYVFFGTAGPYATDFIYLADELIDIEAVIGCRYDVGFVAGPGLQQFTGGLGAEAFTFSPGNTNGDTVVAFSGTGGEGDILYLYGYGAGATFTQIDPTHWNVSNASATIVETITFIGGALIVPATDVVFG